VNDLRKSKILLVDDSKENINVLIHSLKDEYRLAVSINGKDALKYVGKNHVDLILLDIMMPEVDGFEVCRKLKEDATTIDIPVIFITALDAPKHKQTGLELGAVDFITKPFDTLEVKARIKTHLNLKIAQEALKHEIAMRKQAQFMAESANEAKAEFLAKMSHEIRTPLNGIIGIAELISESDLNSDQQDLFQVIINESNSLLWIVNDILDFSKIEAGKLELEKIPFDLRYLLEDVANNIAYNAEKKGLEFIAFYPPDVPSRFIGDPGRLRQILNNLLSNALKFTAKGEISVKAELLEDLGNRLKIRLLVKDTGIGITKEKQASIFDSFTQADNSTTRKYGGTGLGTTICKQLVEQMGGEIGVESEKDKGARFWFNVTLVKQPEQNNIPIENDFAFNDLRVLVVDSIETNRFVLIEYLKSLGCLPSEAQSSEVALSVLAESAASNKPFDLIIIGGRLPEVSGFDLAIKIRSSEDVSALPMVMLTTNGNRGDGKKCRELGIEGYLTKPLKLENLRSTMEMVLCVSNNDKDDQMNPDLVTKHVIAENVKKKNRILLVEDYPTNQQVIMKHLEKAGYDVDLSENGQQAIEAVKRGSYDLIIMDIQMPIMDGFAATKVIRDMETNFENVKNSDDPAHFQNIPIIALTAHAVKGFKEKCAEKGMNDYLSKPIRRKTLLEKVESWVKSKS
jgi:CheY-like chemotaxis protein